ncbi:MAG: hypothetical protein AAF356_00065 [Planctomycetota bacterium]
MSETPIAPAWIVLPLSGITCVIMAGYLLALREAPDDIVPPSRKRIRSVSGTVSIFTVALSGFGFGYVPPSDARTFVLVWVTVTALLALVLVLAGIDLFDSWRLARRARVKRRAVIAHAARSLLVDRPDLREADARRSAERTAAGIEPPGQAGKPDLRLAGDQPSRTPEARRPSDPSEGERP